MKNKIILFCIFLLFLTAIRLDSMDLYKITERRADYFIIRVNLNNSVKIGSKGTVFSQNKKTAVGTFKVIDVKKNECLCVLETISPDGDKYRIEWISFKNMKRTVKSINIRKWNISFTQLSTNKKHYLSDQPFPLKNIKPLNLSGIKKILFQIEKDTKDKYSADLVSFNQIQQFGLNKNINFTDKKKIYLGTHDGHLSMIYEQYGILHHTAISSNTMNKHKHDIYFFIMLRKK